MLLRCERSSQWFWCPREPWEEQWKCKFRDMQFDCAPRKKLEERRDLQYYLTTTRGKMGRFGQGMAKISTSHD